MTSALLEALRHISTGENGKPLPGLYPMNAESKARYKARKKQR